MKKLILPIIFVLLISGCVSQSQTNINQTILAKDTAVSKCAELCHTKKTAMDFSNGPCLSNKITEDWVCDVAHSPRQTVDDKPENQCTEYGKTASHFVELDENCGFIRAV